MLIYSLGMPAPTTVTTKRIFQVFLGFLKQRKVAFFSTLFFIASATIANTVAPLYYKKFFDVLGEGADVSPALLTVAFSALLGAFFLKIVRWASWRLSEIIANPLVSSIMADLALFSYQKLMRHSYEFFINTFVGKLTRRITRFSSAFEAIFDELAWQLLPLVLSSIVIFSVVYQRSPLIALILFIWMAILLYGNYLVIRWKQKYEEMRSKADSEMSGVLSDGVTNSTTIKLFSGFGHEESLFRAVVERVRQIRLFTWNVDALINCVQGLLSVAVEIAVMVSAFNLYRQGVLTLGDFVLFQTYILTLTEQIWGFARVVRNLYRSFAEAKEMVEMLDKPYDVQDVSNAKALIVTEGKIEFNDVTFNFNDTRKVLEHFFLTIAPHEKTAFVGPSGAGKTTVTKLLFRFYDVTGGSIMIDGQDISKVTQESLRDAIALVPQEPILFHRSLKDNIRYGRRDATDEEVIEAAKKAYCHDFIMSLSEGYETMVGERGVKLSGGERQRVAIARAILKNAPILVLDEATSSLDSESEHLIQEALRTLMEGKTVIAIAHRLSTIITMDRTIVLEDGKVRAMGTHQELLAKDELYKRLWSIQAGGFLTEDDSQ